MKSRNQIILSIAVLLLATACSDFFDNKPLTALTKEEAFSKLENIEPLLSGLYTNWRDNTRKDRWGLVFQLGTDEAQQGAYQVRTDADQSAMDKYNGFLAPSNNTLTRQWDDRWRIITSSAAVVSALELNTEDPSRRDMLLGEACFIRAILNFEVSLFWGEIPVIDDEIIDQYGMGRQPLDRVYALIVKDLERAVEYLPTTQSDKRKVTKGAAQTMLGKVYMSAPPEADIRDYAKAAEYFKSVIDNSQYRLADNFADLFDANKPNTTESIYEFQFSNVSPDQNQVQWQTGSRALADAERGYCYFGGYDLILPTKYCYSSVEDGGLWEDGDTRRYESIRYDFTYGDFIPVLQNWFGGDELSPHIKKYEDIRTDKVMSFWYSGKNIPYLRLADVYLCYAECLNEIGRTSEAVEFANIVRMRAWNGSLPDDKKWSSGMSQSDFRVTIMDERMRELCFEGWRRMDLIRTGNFVQLIKERNQWAREESSIQEFHTRFPIPLTEIRQNEDINEEDQNPGYKLN
ncbi:MAG: RagB/SusD family nutrient uptake outer membrane protein [Tannerella sp.]|jgi:tetratricopeptide (TPR) repeat protein|nr:RagB/SusD family nutrient uptake outer membrane protein [Tannerella sp.]